MTKIVMRGERSYVHRTAGRETVFLADQQRSSDAHAPWHQGNVLLVAWLDPIMAGEAMAEVRLPDGTLRTVPAARICATDNLAGRRIVPRRPAAMVERFA
jgi:hypothetical protein